MELSLTVCVCVCSQGEVSPQRKSEIPVARQAQEKAAKVLVLSFVCSIRDVVECCLSHLIFR